MQDILAMPRLDCLKKRVTIRSACVTVKCGHPRYFGVSVYVDDGYFVIVGCIGMKTVGVCFLVSKPAGVNFCIIFHELLNTVGCWL